MNEEELKKIWQADTTAPAVDFQAFQTSLDRWQNKLRRKIKIDIGMQIVSILAVFVVVWFYPKLYFLIFIAVAVAVWYVRKILVLYRQETSFTSGGGSAKSFLGEKLGALKSFINQTRVLMYIMPFVIGPAVLFGLGFFRNFEAFQRQINSVIFPIAVGEVMAIVLTEIYFKIFYSSAVRELEELLRQLNFEE